MRVKLISNFSKILKNVNTRLIVIFISFFIKQSIFASSLLFYLSTVILSYFLIYFILFLKNIILFYILT